VFGSASWRVTRASGPTLRAVAAKRRIVAKVNFMMEDVDAEVWI
jgi:hypothetical protein